MSGLPVPEEWQTRWHAAGSADGLAEGEAREVRAAGRVLRVARVGGRLHAVLGGDPRPLMVVDDEIWVLLGDAPG